MRERFEEEGSVGDVGEIVEIDECKISRLKYERGRVVDSFHGSLE